MVLTLIFIEHKFWQLCLVFLLHILYFGIQLTHVKAVSRKLRATEWINFAFCLLLSYYQLIVLLEDDGNYSMEHIGAWFFNGLFALFFLINMGR